MAIEPYKTSKGILFRVNLWIDGKRVCRKRGFTSKLKAKRYEEQERALYLKEKPRDRLGQFTLNDLVNQYRQIHLPTLKVTTIERYEEYLVMILGSNLGIFELSKINAFDIDKLRMKFLNDGYHTSTVNDAINFLMSLFRKAVDWAILEKAPTGIKPLKEEKKEYLWWKSQFDIEKFLRVAKEKSRYYAVFLLALKTGIRQAEIVGLHKSDFDPKTGSLRIERQWRSKYRKTDSLKDSCFRVLNLDEGTELHQVLTEQLKKNPESEILFPSKSGGRIKARWLADKHFQSLIARSNVPRIRFHDLRHTFASWFMIEIGDIWTLMQILGHSDIATTMKYAHVTGSKNRVGSIMGFTENRHTAAPQSQKSNLKLMK